MNQPNRIFYFDNLKTFLTILVVIFHAALTYGSPGNWYYKENVNDWFTVISLTAFVAICQSFFMSLFFYIAGYFVQQSYEKKGGRKFLVDRIIRLGVPCLLFFFGIGQLTIFLASKYLYKSEFHYLQHPNIGPLWFAMLLLIFSMIYVLILKWIPAIKSLNIILTKKQSTLIFICIVLLTFVIRGLVPKGISICGIQFGDLPQYISMFTLGVLTYKHNWIDQIKKVNIKKLKLILIFLLLSLPALMLIGHDNKLGFIPLIGLFHWQSLAYSLWDCLMCVTVSLFLIKLFKEKINFQTNLTNWLSRSAFSAYIIHPLILVIGSIALINLNIHPLMKFALLSLFGVIGSFLVGSMIRRVPILKKIL